MHIHFVALICFIGTVLAYLWGKSFIRNTRMYCSHQRFYSLSDYYMSGVFQHSVWQLYVLQQMVSLDVRSCNGRICHPDLWISQSHSAACFFDCFRDYRGYAGWRSQLFYLARLFHFDAATSYSLMSRSISTPLPWKSLSRRRLSRAGDFIHCDYGDRWWTLGQHRITCSKIDSKFAQGASLGSAAHGFGTSTAFKRHKEEGVAACLSMVLAVFSWCCLAQV